MTQWPPLQSAVALRTPNSSVMCATSAVCHCQELPKDILAKSVSIQRRAVDACYAFYDKAAHNDRLRFVLASNQSVHALAVLSIGLVCAALYPAVHPSSTHPQSLVTCFVYLISLSLHIGAQFWMTFVSGLSLYFSLPRHAFGDVQKILFPRYFTLNSFLSAITLISYTKLNNQIAWTRIHYIQLWALSVCFLMEALSRLYIAPRVVSLMSQVRQLELQVEGLGSEVGRLAPSHLVSSPLYLSLHSAFRRMHGLMAIANILAMFCTVLHLVHLAQSINFS